MNSLLSTQVSVLARRSIRKTLRQPFQLFPIVFFPIILLAVNASGLKSATELAGFPTHSYVSFAIAVAFIQGALFALINTGTNLRKGGITAWVKEGLTLVKMHELLERSGTAVPYRTLARFAAEECGYSSSSRPGVTVPVADGKPGEEVQLDFGYLGMISDGDRLGGGCTRWCSPRWSPGTASCI